jgi:hypothetical protein
MSYGKSDPYKGESMVQLVHPDPWKAMRESKPSFILFYKNGYCCAIVGTEEEAHMDFSSITMKYDIKIEDYSSPDWDFFSARNEE